MKIDFKSVDKYIKSFPKGIQSLLEKVRATIREKAPEVTESVSYGMPAYKIYGKPLVYFAGFKNHIGLYATPTGHLKFAEELAEYRQGKGSIQFPLNKPIPFDLIGKIVEYRVNENLSKK